MDARRAWSAAPQGRPMAPIMADLMVLAKLATPVVIARLGIMAMGLTDALVVGRYSAVQLGYHALGWAPTAVVLVVSISLLSGIQVMTSRAIGEGRPHLAGAVLAARAGVRAHDRRRRHGHIAGVRAALPSRRRP